MDFGTLIVLGMVMAVIAVVGLIGLIIWAVLTYVVKYNYPWIRRAAFWAARLENFLPLLVLSVLLFVLIIFILIFSLKLPPIATLLLLLLLVVIVLILIPVEILLLLGIARYAFRLIFWLFARWKGLLIGFWPQILKLKIKHDVGKDKDKDWTTHFAEMRNRLSAEAEQARRKISGKGK